jgi:hypothetical protein
MHRRSAHLTSSARRQKTATARMVAGALQQDAGLATRGKSWLTKRVNMTVHFSWKAWSQAGEGRGRQSLGSCSACPWAAPLGAWLTPLDA